MRYSIGALLSLFVALSAARAEAPKAPVLRPGKPEAHGVKADDLKALREALTEAARKSRRGVSLLLARRGEVIFREAFGGLKTGDAVMIASSTKPVVATALMVLVDQGKVDLDAPVTRYLPELRGTKMETAKVRQLLCHSAGAPTAYPGGRPKAGTLADFSKKVAREGKLSAPGTFSYSGVSIDLCARIAEVASGLPFEEHLQKTVLRPLGMKKTHFTLAASREVEPAGGSGRYVSGGGGLSSTLDDLGAFYQMHLNGGAYGDHRVLSGKAVAQMQSKNASNPRRALAAFGNDYGLGFYLARPASKGGGYQTFSHGGALGTMPWADRDRDLVGVIFVPGSLAAAAPVIAKVQKLVREMVPAKGGR